jgi:hypothetical protein
MTCNTCGRQLPEGSSICEFCANDNQEFENTNSGGFSEDLSFHEAPKKGGGGKFLIMGAVVAAILLIAGVTYAAMNIFVSTKTLYLQIEQKNLKSTINTIADSYVENYNTEVKPLLDKSYQQKQELSFNTDLKDIPGIDPQMAESISSLIGKFKFTLDSKVNQPKKQSLHDINVSVEGSPLLKGTIFQDDMKFGLNFPDIYNKYVTADASELKSIFKNFGVETTSDMPDKFKFLDNNEIYKAINISRDDFTDLAQKYIEIYVNSLNDDAITLEKDVTFEANGEQIKCKKFVLKFDEKWFKSFMVSVYDAASEDDILFDKFYTSFVNVMKLYRDAGYLAGATEDLDEILSMDKNKFKEKFINGRADFVSSIEKLKLPAGLTMSLWANNSKEILGRRIEFTIDDGTDKIKTVINTNSYTRDSDDAKINSIELEMSPEEGSTPKDKLTIKISMEKMEDSSSKFNMTFDIMTNGEPKSLTLNVDCSKPEGSVSKDGLKQNVKFDFTLKNNGQEVKFSGQADITKTANDKEKTKSSEYDISLNFNVPEVMEQAFKFGIKYKNELTLDKDFKLPELTSSNSLNLNNANSEELETAMQEVMVSVQSIIMKNSKLFESLMPQY